MLVLMFYIGAKAYCTKADAIECIIPNLSSLPLDEKGLLTLRYKHNTLDIIDLSFCYTHRPTTSHFSTRISIVKNCMGSQAVYWGFRAEHMRQLYTIEEDALKDSVYLGKTPCQYLALEKVYETLRTLKASRATPLPTPDPALELCLI
jgi:hypothetical protein